MTAFLAGVFGGVVGFGLCAVVCPLWVMHEVNAAQTEPSTIRLAPFVTHEPSVN